MEISKARAIIKEYRDNGFKQGKALEKIGYSKKTAQVASGKIINRALHRIIEEDRIALMESNNPKETLLQMVGVTPQQVIGEYMAIIRQDKDLTNKLKALQPLLKQLGITWEEKQQQSAPVLNLTVKEVSVNSEPNKAVDYTSHNLHSATQQTAPNLSPTIENGSVEPYFDERGGGGVDSDSEEEKEGGSPIPNFVENSSIDTTDTALHNNNQQ